MDAEAIKRSLEGNGLRCTPQRYAVMAFLMECNRHPTAAEIFQAVNIVDPSGTTCAGLLRAPWARGFFANVNSFSGDSVRSALGGTLPVKCPRRMDT